VELDESLLNSLVAQVVSAGYEKSSAILSLASMNNCRAAVHPSCGARQGVQFDEAKALQARLLTAIVHCQHEHSVWRIGSHLQHHVLVLCVGCSPANVYNCISYSMCIPLGRTFRSATPIPAYHACLQAK